jgi:hypothetical protein
MRRLRIAYGSARMRRGIGQIDQSKTKCIGSFSEGLRRAANRHRVQLCRPKCGQNRRPIKAFGFITQPRQVNHDRLPTEKIRLLLAHPLKRFLQGRRRRLPKQRAQRGGFESFEFDG